MVRYLVTQTNTHVDLCMLKDFKCYLATGFGSEQPTWACLKALVNTKVLVGKITNGPNVFFQITQKLDWSRNFHLDVHVSSGTFLCLESRLCSSGLPIWGQDLHIDPGLI